MKIKITLLFCLLTFSFSGCTSKIVEDTPLAEVVEKIEEIEIEVTPEEYTIPTTMEELYALSLEDFKKMIEENIPDYYEFFKIEEGYILTDSDWESLRDILSLHLFQDRIIPLEEMKEEIVETYNDPNAIYYNPSYEYIESMNREDFIIYLTGLYEYVYPNGEFVDFSPLTDEQIEQLKTELLSEIKQ